MQRYTTCAYGKELVKAEGVRESSTRARWADLSIMMR
jgi:hypothetical protein